MGEGKAEWCRYIGGLAFFCLSPLVSYGENGEGEGEAAGAMAWHGG
jgi:hypothetical protein